MKKPITILMSIFTFVLVAFSSVGCNIESTFESDGKFKYKYLKSSDGYAIVGTEDDGYSDPMYIPVYYKGKPVVSVGYHQNSYMGGGTNYSIDYGDATKIFYPFSVNTNYHLTRNRASYIISTESGFSYATLGEATNVNTILYLSAPMFDRIHEEIIDYSLDIKVYPNLKYKKLSSTRFGFHYSYREDPMIIVQKANASYMFNYGGAPNNDYFFINNFKNGALIENTPYEPLRTGYTFDGWYREPECINKCNFGTDIYIEQYDKEGNLISNEMKLYAKWIKN